MPLSPAHISHTRCCARSIFTLGAQISFAGSCIETPGTYYWYYVPACYSNISGVFEKHEKKKRPSCEIKKFFKTHLWNAWCDTWIALYVLHIIPDRYIVSSIINFVYFLPSENVFIIPVSVRHKSSILQYRSNLSPATPSQHMSRFPLCTRC